MKQATSLSVIVLFSFVLLSCSQPNQPLEPQSMQASASPTAYTTTVNRENPASVKLQDSKMASLTALVKDFKDWFTQCLDDAMLAIAN